MTTQLRLAPGYAFHQAPEVLRRVGASIAEREPLGTPARDLAQLVEQLDGLMTVGVVPRRWRVATCLLGHGSRDADRVLAELLAQAAEVDERPWRASSAGGRLAHEVLRLDREIKRRGRLPRAWESGV